MGNTIQASFGLNINPLRAGAAKAQGLMQALGKRMGGFITSPMAQVGGAVSAFFTYQAFKSGIAGVIASGTELKRMSSQTGITVGSLSMLKAAAMQADVEFGPLATTVAKMQRNLYAAAKGASPVRSSLHMIGVEIDKVATLKPEEQFKIIGSAISKLPSPMLRAAASMSIFGRSGAELLPMFEQMDSMDFGNLSDKAKLMEKDAEMFHQITVSFRKASANLKSIFLGIADQIGPVILAVSNVFSKKSALEYGKAIGASLRSAAELFIGVWQDPGKMLDGFGNLLLSVTASGMNLLVNGCIKAGVIAQEGFKLAWEIIKPVGQFLGGAFTRSTGVLIEGFGRAVNFIHAGLEFAFQNAIAFFDRAIRPIVGFIAAGLAYAVDQMKAAIGKIPFLGKKTGLAGFQAKTFEQHLAAQRERSGSPFQAQSFTEILARNQNNVFEQAGQAMQSAGDKMMDSSMDGLANIRKAIQDFAEGSASVFQASINKDFFGADIYLAKAQVALNQLRAAGKEVLDKTTPKNATETKNPWSRFMTFSSFNGSGALNTSQVKSSGSLVSAGGLSKGAYGATDILKHSERRGLMDALVAQGEEKRHASTIMAFGSVHSGDRKRRLEVERQQAKDNLKVDKTNELLGKIKEGVEAFAY